MGQYHKVVNLTKREYVDPHVLGCGLKMWEQVATFPGTPNALFLLIASPEGRGLGDVTFDSKEKVIGRWAGDRVVLAGDYAENRDVKDFPMFREVYFLCNPHGVILERMSSCTDPKRVARWRKALAKYGAFKDISHLLVPVIEKTFEGRFIGEGWRDFIGNETYENPPADLPEHLRWAIEADKAADKTATV